MPRYANLTATLALFVALGGTATAAVTLDRDSVTSREIARNAVARGSWVVQAKFTAFGTLGPFNACGLV
jgi:hypothetical protein